MTLVGPTLLADAPVAAVVFGAPFELSSDRQLLTTGRTFTLSPGDVLRVRGTPRAMRAYLCVAGGFDSPVILGSRSALAPIRSGQILACPESSLPNRFIDPAASPAPSAAMPLTLRFIPGQQADWFDLSAFAAGTYSIGPASDRMGLRMVGQALVRPKREMISEPVCPGTVQVTNDGQCIILGIDGQTIGGYPKIAQIVQADLDILGQLRPGDTIRFHLVSIAEAETAALERIRQLDHLLAHIAAAVCSGVGRPSTL
jgi:antagonist of KipI